METKQGYFDPKMPRHLDDRFFKATKLDILAIPLGARFKGMEVFAFDEGEWWQFKDGVTDPDLVPSGRGGDISAETYSWTWSEGVDHLGTHLDFVIATATADNEIGSIDSCIFFVGGSVQVGNYTIEDTNFAADTIRILGTAGEREGTVEVVLFYNRAGSGYLSEWKELLDTPSSYSGEALRTPKVNDAENALEYGYGFWKGTQAEYDALGAPQKADVNIIHFIVED